MKMFRRISALALAVVMICLLSASAFAYDYYVSHPFYDMEDSFVVAFADISQYETSGTVEIQPTALLDQYINIEIDYQYYIGATLHSAHSINETETSNPYLTVGTNNRTEGITKMYWADYTYAVYFTTLSGQFNEFYSGPVRITYNG